MGAREFLSITVVFLAITCLMLHVQLGADAGKSRKKRNYILEVTKMDEPITDPEWVTVKYVKIGKYNRTTPAISVVLSLLRDLPDNTLVSGQSYQQMGGGQYGKGPMALPETDLCKFIENDTVAYPSFRKASNLPEKCPFKKMELKVVNFNINDVNLPSELPPPNDWMVEITVTHPEKRKTIISARFYVVIKRDGKFGAMG